MYQEGGLYTRVGYLPTYHGGYPPYPVYASHPTLVGVQSRTYPSGQQQRGLVNPVCTARDSSFERGFVPQRVVCQECPERCPFRGFCQKGVPL